MTTTNLITVLVLTTHPDPRALAVVAIIACVLYFVITRKQ